MKRARKKDTGVKVTGNPFWDMKEIGISSFEKRKKGKKRKARREGLKSHKPLGQIDRKSAKPR